MFLSKILFLVCLCKVLSMEYSFTHNDIGEPVAQLNMEAEAFGHWLNIEMSGADASALAKVVGAVEQLSTADIYQFECSGREFHLELSRHQARVSANALLEETPNDVHPEDDKPLDGWDVNDYDELAITSSGLVGSCGLEDFEQLITAWREFLQH